MKFALESVPLQQVVQGLLETLAKSFTHLWSRGFPLRETGCKCQQRWRLIINNDDDDYRDDDADADADGDDDE
jgi:hypothetical protein